MAGEVIMNIGFTGTRKGMTDEQETEVKRILLDHLEGQVPNKRSQFHHGCCVGADFQACLIAKLLGYITVGHPPTNTKLKHQDISEIMLAPKPHIERNHVIVDMTDRLIACPETCIEQPTGGTWSTYRYARKMKKQVDLVLPTGRVVAYEKRDRV